MRFSISTIIGIFLGVSTFIFFVSNVRPVGWFDSLVGMILGIIVFVVVKRFKGFKWTKQVQPILLRYRGVSLNADFATSSSASQFKIIDRLSVKFRSWLPCYWLDQDIIETYGCCLSVVFEAHTFPSLRALDFRRKDSSKLFQVRYLFLWSSVSFWLSSETFSKSFNPSTRI